MQCDICSATATAPAKGLCREDATSPGSLSHGDGGDVGAVGGEDGGSLSTGAAAPLCVTQGLSPGGGDVPWVHSSWGWGHLSPNRAEEQWTQFRAGLTLPSMWVQHCTAPKTTTNVVPALLSPGHGRWHAPWGQGREHTDSPQHSRAHHWGRRRGPMGTHHCYQEKDGASQGAHPMVRRR